MKLFIRFSALALTALLVLTGCGNPQTVSQPATETTQTTEAAAPHRHLSISLEVDKDADTKVFDSEELNGNFLYTMQYHKVNNVTISIDGETYPLETALAKGAVNEEDIFYFARQDARARICEMEVESVLGVSNFYFHYPEYSLRLIYDVNETPDGSQHLISEFHVYARELPGKLEQYELLPCGHFYDPESGEALDREDWGLTFEVQQASTTEVTITCTQSGGQQIGQLAVKYYYLFENDGPALKKAEEAKSASFETIPLETDGATTFTIDWTDWYGTLPSGSYFLLLDVYDLFDPDQVHPLMVDFHDWQQYSVFFAISE